MRVLVWGFASVVPMAKSKKTPVHGPGGRLPPTPSKPGSKSATKAVDGVARSKDIDRRSKANAGVLTDKDQEEVEEVDDFEEEDDVELLDVNAAIVKCKVPPAILLEEDWVKLHNLEGTGVNPKRFSNTFKTPEQMSKLFGKRSGRRGRNGYKWQDILQEKVMNRVLELHPVIYQHDPQHMPPTLAVKFAEGIQHEFQHGRGSVNWAAFAEDVNQKQRKRRVDTRERLQYCKDNGVTRVSKEDMLKIKLETPLPSAMGPGSTSRKVSFPVS